ncbi:MAG: hypothetical protein WCO08_05110 [Actinomycetes bacterium]
MDQNNVDLGIAGSLTMIVLTISVALLLWSFYRRYKRVQNPDAPSTISDKSAEEVDEK